MNNVDETIYNLLNQSPQSSSSNFKPYYRSNFSANAFHHLNKSKNAHRTMGLAIIPKPDPSHPLRRREKYIELPQITPFIRIHRMPPIPKIIDQNDNQLKSSKNFIRENVRKMINSLPICPRRYIVSDRKGNKFLIDGSGLQKDFIHKKNYGQIPSYLQAYKAFNQPINCPTKENSPVVLPEEERLCLINNLRARYHDVFAEYQRLPLHVETTSTKIKEASLNNQLIDLERDIDFLEKHRQIFIIHPCSDVQ